MHVSVAEFVVSGVSAMATKVAMSRVSAIASVVVLGVLVMAKVVVPGFWVVFCLKPFLGELNHKHKAS